MSSLLTNTSAMSALRLLTGTQQNLGKTQDQISTGLRVAQASDNAAYWSIGVSMKSQVGALAAGQDSLSLEMGILQTAQAALTLVRQDVVGIGDDLIQALQPGTDKGAIEGDVAARQIDIVKEASGASFDGVNILVDQYVHDFAASNDIDQWGNSSVDRGLGENPQLIYRVPTGSSGGTLELKAFSVFTTLDGHPFPGPGGFGTAGAFVGSVFDTFATTNMDNLQSGILDPTVLDFSVTAPPAKVNPSHTGDATDSDLQAARKAVEQVLRSLASMGAQLGGQVNLVATMQDFDSHLSDALTAGVGALVDADMNVASTKLQALQVQQQLGVQALSIANDDSRAVLKLFGI